TCSRFRRSARNSVWRPSARTVAPCHARSQLQDSGPATTPYAVGLRADVKSKDRSMSERKEVPLLIAFVALMGYAVQCTRVADDEVANVVDGYYELVAAGVAAAGGRVVKNIGDGVLIVFDGDAA